jgi:hypothetical protein
MFSTGRRHTHTESLSSKHRAGKSSFSKKRTSFKAGSSRRYEQAAADQLAQQQQQQQQQPGAPQVSP